MRHTFYWIKIRDFKWEVAAFDNEEQEWELHGIGVHHKKDSEFLKDMIVGPMVPYPVESADYSFMMKVEDLLKDSANWRCIDPELIDRLAADINVNGLKKAISIDKTGDVLDGRHRLLAVRKLRKSEIAVKYEL